MKKKVNIYKNDNKRFILVFTMIFCIVISMITYWIYAYDHKHGYLDSKEKIISYKVSDYVSIEGNVVKLKNVTEKINADFLAKQKKMLENNIINTEISKGLYHNILSIKISYTIYGELANYEEVITLNIDLKENKVLNSSELLKIVNKDYKDVANDIFENYIRLTTDRVVKDAITEEEMSSLEFNNNSEKYIIRIREKLPNILGTYIDDNKIYYTVRLFEINKVCYYTNTDAAMVNINREIGRL